MEQTTQEQPSAPSGSKKTLLIVGGVIVLVLIGGGVLRAKRGVQSAAIGGAAHVDSNNGQVTVKTDEGTWTAGSNKLPDNWPSDVPAYAGATVQYAASVNPSTGKEGVYVMLQSSDSASKVLDFYKAQLVAQGWTIGATGTSGDSSYLTGEKETRALSVIIASSNGSTSITIGVGAK